MALGASLKKSSRSLASLVTEQKMTRNEAAVKTIGLGQEVDKSGNGMHSFLGARVKTWVKMYIFRNLAVGISTLHDIGEKTYVVNTTHALELVLKQTRRLSPSKSVVCSTSLTFSLTIILMSITVRYFCFSMAHRF